MAKQKAIYYGILILLISECVICMKPSGKETQIKTATEPHPKIETKSLETVPANSSTTKLRQHDLLLLKDETPIDNKKPDSRILNSKGEKILILADVITRGYSHLRFNIEIADILHEAGYTVHFFYGHLKQGNPADNWKLRPRNKFLFKPIPLDPPTAEQVEAFNSTSKIQYNWDKFFYFVAIHNALTENHKVEINNEEHNIFDWLLEQKYALGMSEFVPANFALFNQLHLKWIALSAMPPPPHLLGYLGIQAHETPGFRGLDGDIDISWPLSYKMEMQIEVANARRLAFYNGQFQEVYVRYYNLAAHMRRNNPNPNPKAHELVVPPPLDELFRRSAAFCVNQHYMAKFPGVPYSPLVKNIGGILVEGNADIMNKPLEMPTQPKLSDLQPKDCLVYFSLGTAFELEDDDDKPLVHELFRNIKQFAQECQFIVRISTKLLPKNYVPIENVKVHDDSVMLDQKEILARPNTRLFVSHCGLNSFNEALYASVPLICVPLGGDQYYNALMVKYLGIGIWMKKEDFDYWKFFNLMRNIINDDRYHIKAKKLALQIREDIRRYPSQLKKNILVQTVAKVIGSAIAADGNRMGPAAKDAGTSAAATSSASASSAHLLTAHFHAPSGSSKKTAVAPTENEEMPHSKRIRLARVFLARKSGSHAELINRTVGIPTCK